MEAFRTAIDLDLFAAPDIFREIPGEVAYNEQVEVTIVVVVDKARADRPLTGRYTGLGGYIFKGPVAAVAVEHVGSEVGEIEIDESVVIEIARGNAHAVPRVTSPGDAGLLRNVGERAVALVSVQPVRVARMRAVDGDALVVVDVQATAVEEENVEQPVAVVVEQAHAATHRFDEELTAGAPGLVNKVDAGRFPAIFEDRQRFGR